MDERLTELLIDQDGVVSREQVLKAGLQPHDVKRLLRRRELVRLHPGVYLNHTGDPTWHQRCWAAVLLLWPAALTHHTALRAAEGPGSQRRIDVIEVAVARNRSRPGPPGIRALRTDHLQERVQWHLGPPRVRYEDAVVDVAVAAVSDFAALGEVSRAVQGRRTTAARLLDCMAARPRVPRRAWLEGVLADVSSGACSVLEHGYLTRVERAHGMGGAQRQVHDRVGQGVIYRDVEYRCGLVVELDGRLFHDTTAQRDRDLDRDLVAAAGGKDSVRIGYGQVFDRSCWTARQVATIMRRRGWRGRGRPCGPTCTWT